MKVPCISTAVQDAHFNDGCQAVVFSDNDADKINTVFSVKKPPYVDVESVDMEIVLYDPVPIAQTPTVL